VFDLILFTGYIAEIQVKSILLISAFVLSNNLPRGTLQITLLTDQTDYQDYPD
jgi:hypothetical protein